MDENATYFSIDQGQTDGLIALIDQTLTAQDAPQAAQIVRNVPIYDMTVLSGVLDDPASRPGLLAEWADVLRHSAGVLVLRGAYADTGPVDAATAVFDAIIADEAAGGAKADHFAAAGNNARVWNAAQKLCLRDPAAFAAYHGNTAISAVCEAWLGPDYQVTAQVNLVRPGGQAQTAHRDYHLGFKTAADAARFPAHVHELTAALTLQGAVAHSDMPVESGPTKLLPFSQVYAPGYLAFHDDAHRALFEARCVQVPLFKGDALFFNPALFHGAGANTSVDVQRMANLLQVSSAFGRAMEMLDRIAMAKALYPALCGSHDLTPAQIDAAIAACAEGYAFPTNLDADPPVGGLAPQSQADLMRQGLAEGWTPDAFAARLDETESRRRA
jgi:ectoine hydroxylase-related dioxygenase (phytanoyl-CoA dioxygenase family)